MNKTIIGGHLSIARLARPAIAVSTLILLGVTAAYAAGHVAPRGFGMGNFHSAGAIGSGFRPITLIHSNVAVPSGEGAIGSGSSDGAIGSGFRPVSPHSSVAVDSGDGAIGSG